MGALLSGGALPDAPDVTGVTALMAAAGQGHLDCMDVLLGFDAGKAGFRITTVKHLHALHCVREMWHHAQLTPPSEAASMMFLSGVHCV